MIQTVANNTPISERPRWGKDYADPVTFLEPLFYGKNIIAAGNTNYSLVGLTAAQAKALKVTGTTTDVPSIDKGIETCAAQHGRARIAVLRRARSPAHERRSCRGSRTSGVTS